MTILNVWVSPERALVAVDTIGGRADTLAPHEVSKMMPFVHSSLMLGGAGNAGVMQAAYWQLMQHQADHLVDFDFAANALPQVIERIWGEFVSSAMSAGVPLSSIAPWQSLVIVGWSERFQRMCGQYQQRGPDDAAFCAPRPVAPYLLAPNFFETGPDAPDTSDKMQECFEVQLAAWRQRVPEMPTGGRMVIAEMTRHSTNISSRALPG